MCKYELGIGIEIEMKRWNWSCDGKQFDRAGGVCIGRCILLKWTGEIPGAWNVPHSIYLTFFPFFFKQRLTIDIFFFDQLK